MFKYVLTPNGIDKLCEWIFMNTLQHTDTEITYRQYRHGDEHAIVKLFNFVFNRNMTIDQWDWAYKENPERRLDIILAFQGTQLVGQSASTPLLFCFKGNPVKVTRVQNVMVHPDCRGKGIFTGTLKRLTEYIYQNKLDLVVTFPNNNSLLLFGNPTVIRKLDYHHLADIFTFSLPVSSLTPVDSPDISVHIDEAIHFTERDRDFIFSCMDQYEIFNARGLDYLHWRFKGTYGKKYHILRAYQNNLQVALVIFKYYPDAQSVDLVEFFVSADKKVVLSLLNSINTHYMKNDVRISSFNIWLFPHYALYKILRDIGFCQSTFSTHVVTKSFSLVTKQGFDDLHSYYLSMGDSDVY